MDILFSFTLNQPFFKDRCGYKIASYEPGVFYGYIDADINLENKPQSEHTLTVNEQRFRDLLNNKVIETEVQVATNGVAGHQMLSDSRCVMLRYCGSTYNIQIELLSFNAKPVDKKSRSAYSEQGTAICKMRILDKIPEILLPKDKRTYLPKQGPQWINIAKFCLNHPGKYYYSDWQHFFTSKPQNLERFLAIYNIERNFNRNIPTGETVLLDPLSYTDHSVPITADLARRILTGSF